MYLTQLLSALALGGVAAAGRSTRHVGGFADRLQNSGRNIAADLPLMPRDFQASAKRATAASQFLTNTTSKFVVNGTAIPDVDFDVGESYAGLIPLDTGANSSDSELYFWFFPSENPAANKEILIWLNGGPGCSSLEGFLQENGPFLWQYGTYKPVANPYSWHKLTNVVWVEQPVGTGFSQGIPTATSEEDVAKQFMSWFKNFVDAFGMQGYSVYITGESYAGQYVPYIASAMLDANDTTYYNVSGIMIYDPSIAYDYLQSAVTVLPFVESNAAVFPFNDTFWADIRARDAACGYADFRDKFLSFPPPSLLPGPDDLPSVNNDSCQNLYWDIYDAVMAVNPCFDIYAVATTCPLLWDVLGFPGSFGYQPEGASIYFNRTDVQAAINAPKIEWEECASGDVFVGGGDSSLPSSVTVLPGVIERTQNVIVGHGALDMVLIANGTLLSIQNMTWGGAQGFQTAPKDPFYVPNHDEPSLSTIAASGVMGTTHTERGLTYVGIVLSGHMVPQYQPTAAYRQLEVLLGRVSSLSSVDPFTTDANVTQVTASELAAEGGNFP
ncbi:carboxypeptidase precursor [Diaporthe amygdali]|uniref:carboxypeptidase precursor n=1 Tax=Phomopsis amygdali TaxID=1214568 RepID=UPI0022FE26F6|nr:carboxypeptidase precursor [Diaporthe amygdali]KAJ0119292.1 carboxypeptidase precursor [Diaporthe amygdali]